MGEEKRRAMLREEGMTEAGRRIGRYLLGDAVPELSETERYLGDRYKQAANRDRLGLPAGRVRGKAARG